MANVVEAPTRTLPPPVAPQAGWYPDPYGLPVGRYFDGRMWTHHTTPLAGPPAIVEPHGVLPLQVAIGAVVVLAVSLVASRALIDALVRFDWSIVVYAAISVLVGYGPSVWWCLYAAGRWGSGDRRTDLGLRFRWSDLGWGPLVWLSAFVAQAVVAILVTLLDVPFTSNTEGIGDLDLDRTYVITLLVTAVIAAPIVEEMIFRGLMLRGLLSRMSAWLAVGVQGLLFGAVHLDPVRGMGNIGLALVLSAVGIVLRWCRLPVAAHRADDPRPRHLQRRRDDHRPHRRSQLTPSHGRSTRWAWVPSAPTTCSTTPGRGSSPRSVLPVSRSDGAHTARPAERDRWRCPDATTRTSAPAIADSKASMAARGISQPSRSGSSSGWWTKASTGRSVATASASHSSCSAVPRR